jgi:erythromycin esterase-like protein
VLAAGLNDRDEPMAENVLWLAWRAKVIVLGHNEHWGRTPYRLDDPTLIRSAGSFLAEALGDAYFALGSVVRDGTFLAIEYDDAARNGVIRAHAMTPPSPDDYGVLLDRADAETSIVPLRGTITGTHRLRFAGSTVVDRHRPTLEVEADLGAKFDAVLFVRTSTPTQLRHWPRF